MTGLARLLLAAGLALPRPAAAHPASPLAAGPGVRQRSVPVRLGPVNAVPRLNAGKLAFIYLDAGRVRATLADPGTLRLGRPSPPAPEAPVGVGDMHRWLCAPTQWGWLIAKQTNHGAFAIVTFFTLGLDGLVTRMMPAGVSAEPTSVHAGTTWAGGERFEGFSLLGMVPGGPRGPVLLVLAASPFRQTAEDGRPSLAIVSAGGHPAGAPVPVDPAWLGDETTGLADGTGWLLATHLEPRTSNAWMHGPERIALLRVAADATATVVDAWEIQKNSPQVRAVTELFWTQDRERRVLVWNGGMGVHAVAVGPDGRRADAPRELVPAPPPDPESEARPSAGKLLAARLRGGTIRLILTNPVRLVEAGLTGTADARTRWRFRPEAGAAFALLDEHAAYVYWSWGVEPPPYLTRLAP